MIAVIKQQQIFMGEGGKGGQTAAESGSQQKFGFLRRNYSLINQSINHPDKEASQEIYEKGSPWKAI